MYLPTQSFTPQQQEQIVTLCKQHRVPVTTTEQAMVVNDVHLNDFKQIVRHITGRR